MQIFDKGKTTYGPNAWSTKIMKLLEDQNCENLRSDGFPKELIDEEPKNIGREL